MRDDLLSAALAAIHAGVSIIPVDHTTKRPMATLLPHNAQGKPTWKPYQERIATENEVRRWCKAGVQAFAVVCGRVSGGRPGYGLLVLDFDAVGFIQKWAGTVGRYGNGLPVQQTGGGGHQVLLRCPDPGANGKLAWAIDDAEATGRTIAIETRGEGGYAVVAPSRHPTGRAYQWLGTLTAANVPAVTQGHAEKLLAAARSLDEAPWTRQERELLESHAIDTHRKRQANLDGQPSVIDAFNQAYPIESLLDRSGYTKGSNGRYIRPGGKSESVSVKDRRSCHWSSDDPLNDGRVVSGCGCHDAFDLYAYFEHGGDLEKAVKAAAHLLGLNFARSVSGTKTSRKRGRCGGFADACPPYRPFPVHALPAVVGRIITEGAQALGCDAAYIALPLLAMLAAAIGNSRRIRLKASWAEPPVLWMVVVADSGTLKSPAFDLALRPIRQRQDGAMKEHQQALAEYREAMEQYDDEVKAWRKTEPAGRGDRPQEPQAPVCERLWCSDTTVEALADRLSSAPRGLLVARDELSGWLGSFNQYKAGQGGDVAHWLEMHRAGPLLVDRKSGDKTTTYVPRASVCIAGGIQPERLQQCLTPEFFANGLVARMLLTMPPKRLKQWTEADIDANSLDALRAMFDELLQFQPESDVDGGPEPADVALTDGAKMLWVSFFDAHAREQADLEGDLSAAWSKLEGYAARLALVVHCIRQAAGEAVDPWQCDEVSMQAGIALAKWFGNETKRVYAAMWGSGGERHGRELVDLIQSMGGRVSVRDLCQRRRKYRGDSSLAHADLQELADAGVGRWEHPAPDVKGGRPRKVLVLNVNEAPLRIDESGVGVGKTSGSDSAKEGLDDVDAVATAFSGSALHPTTSNFR